MTCILLWMCPCLSLETIVRISQYQYCSRTTNFPIPISQEVLRSSAPTCHQLPQESVRAHLQHPSQEEAEVVVEPSGHLDDTAAALSLKTKMLRNHESACFRERKAGFRMAGGWLVLLLASSAAAFYLPGLAPVTYCTTKVQIAFYASLF